MVTSDYCSAVPAACRIRSRSMAATSGAVAADKGRTVKAIRAADNSGRVIRYGFILAGVTGNLPNRRREAIEQTLGACEVFSFECLVFSSGLREGNGNLTAVALLAGRKYDNIKN